MWKEWLHSPSTRSRQDMSYGSLIYLLTQWTFVSRELALGAGTVIGISTDTADIVVGHVPAPGGDGVPFAYGDLHGGGCCSGTIVVVERKDDDGKQTRVVLAGNLLAVNQAAATLLLWQGLSSPACICSTGRGR